MIALVLIGMMMTCAKLWFDVGALRERVFALEGGALPIRYSETIAPAWSRESAMSASSASANVCLADVETVDAVVAEALVPPPATDVESHPEPVVADPIELLTLRGARFEDLFGRKLPIWAGGITLAVAGFLIVKYSIESGLLSPTVRIVFALLFGSALLAGAEAAMRADDRVRDPRVRQALAGAGIATLYGSVLAAANLYHLVGPVTAFVGLALTTLLAGGLSLRFGAPSALLGLVGGLAAPALVGSGTPDVPLLSAYLALTVGGLCALSRTQRWMWLGLAALAGGFGWSALLLLDSALDTAATLAIGGYALLLGIGLPLFAFAGNRASAVRLAGSLAACVQLAGLVALGGFGTLEWGLFGLISIGIIWLSRREIALADLPAAGLTVALLLAAAWPNPTSVSLAAVLAGIVATFGLPAAHRVWKRDWRQSDSIQLAVVSAAIIVLPSLRLTLGNWTVASLALLGATLAAIAATLGWKVAGRMQDRRFAILVTTAATLVAIAAIVVAPAWCTAPAIALVAGGLLLLASSASDPRLDWIAAAFGAAATLALLLTLGTEIERAIGIAGSAASLTAALRWLVPALMVTAFALHSRRDEVRIAAQPLAVLLGCVAAGQITPAILLPLIPIALLVTLVRVPNSVPALTAAATVTAGWATLPFVTWLAAGSGAVLAVPLLITALPPLDDTLLRLVLPAGAAAFVCWRARQPKLRQVARIAAAVLAAASIHIGFKHVFAIADATAFVRLGMAERTVWEMLLAGAALALWARQPIVGRILAAASLAHAIWFTLLLHDPLWTLQAVGGWPVANLLLPAFGTAFALTWLVRDVPVRPLAHRVRALLQMALIVTFVAATLRHAFHGSLLSFGAVGEAEDIARSVLLIALGIGFLRHGITAAARDWRIASLVLMLVAVAKVFLVDAAGLDGLLRITSFAALGFSLIGIGWLYARYLPEDTVLTPNSQTSAMPARGN